jgi:hypothetical protein
MGRTLNISDAGLMLKVETSRINEDYLASKDYSLRVVVAIPAGPVEIYARPMHYEAASDGSYLIGARIERMTSDERARMREYLRDFAPAI